MGVCRDLGVSCSALNLMRYSCAKNRLEDRSSGAAWIAGQLVTGNAPGRSQAPENPKTGGKAVLGEGFEDSVQCRGKIGEAGPAWSIEHHLHR